MRQRGSGSGSTCIRTRPCNDAVGFPMVATARCGDANRGESARELRKKKRARKAPFAKAQAAGINTALGTDGPMVDYPVDMVEQMKICTLMQHVRHIDPTCMPVERTIEMATINGARVLGLEHEIGSLEPGKRADIAVFDMHKPRIGVLNRPLSTFISAGKGSDAKAVSVNGAVAYRDGGFAKGPSFDDVLGEATQRARQIAQAAGHASRFEPHWRQDSAGS